MSKKEMIEQEMKKILNSLFYLSCITSFFFFLSSCEQDYTPKERGYFKIILPQRSAYKVYSNADCPFTFEYPSYSELLKDEKYFDGKPENPCWMNIEMPSINGTIFLSYKTITDKQELNKLVNDANELTYKHTIKASYINPITVHPRADVYGLYYDIGGNAASNVQFFITDSTQHFIRGSLYFRNAPNIDSIAPVLNFVKQDISHLINTVEWK
jgi:gliding motility-associated lipoprotein GldD